jgi:hypothetical protein
MMKIASHFSVLYAEISCGNQSSSNEFAITIQMRMRICRRQRDFRLLVNSHPVCQVIMRKRAQRFLPLNTLKCLSDKSGISRKQNAAF